MKRLALWQVLLILGVLVAFAVFPVPAQVSALDTDSAVLIDNFDVKVNGVSVNPNFNFEDGTTSGFGRWGDASVVTNVGSIGSPDGSAHFARLTTGAGAINPSDPNAFDQSGLRQNFSFSGPVSIGDEVTVSFCYNFLTNEADLQHPAQDRFVASFSPSTNFVQANFSATLREVALSKRRVLRKNAPADSGWLYETGWQCEEDQPLGLLLQDLTSRGFSDFRVQMFVEEYVQLPWIELTLNQPTFRTGETLRVTARVNNPSASPIDLDAKVYLNIPPAVVGEKAMRMPFIKAHDVQIPAGGSFSGEILSYTFSGAEPTGTYWILGALHNATGDFTWMGWDLDFWSFSPAGAALTEELDPGPLSLPSLP